ncbi:LON peptidase substrate-binding domain-containing protein [Puniceicoccales bacterium CK1056]|uniref:LON peptidase substrate-binding domain-containing protein n=1 Tax=Oceanipulchritudo coccoides TaxID=2706888 RepID=A0A6B2LY54_9BACT|nr:LON peptidase substrate-binding domain-containing protein [Oceanipulchritudo coccoides]NDV61273.1 LON peptidase substrate-binding domain-containing protein [Oceanipulchritudo coccoides]
MELSEDIDIPEIIPVMTLRDTVLFPHAVMPLFIFEQRYREMIADILKSHRLFAIFNEDTDSETEGQEEPPAKMGTVGVVRAAHQNPDGTSNLALQGIIRVRLLEVVQESPYRLVRIETCPCEESDEDNDSYSINRNQILSHLEKQPELTRGLPEEYVQFLQSLEQTGPFIDVAIHSICHDPAIKQRLLETLSLGHRYEIFEQFLIKEEARLDLFDKLQGSTRDDEIELN